MRNGTEIEKRPRGRPRGFDQRQALERMLATFWDRGYAATSLDQLALAAGLNRPSLYAAFGDKKAMYRAALSAFSERTRGEMSVALQGPTLVTALRRFYRAAIDVYLSGEDGQRGCLYVCTAAVEAVQHAEIRADLLEVLRMIDAALAARIAVAQAAGEIGSNHDAGDLGRLAAAVLHSLAIRARAGATRRQLEDLARLAVALICTPV
jgi:TetR/AcrR family transcriptional regulator, copper-responsive repressor